MARPSLLRMLWGTMGKDSRGCLLAAVAFGAYGMWAGGENLRYQIGGAIVQGRVLENYDASPGRRSLYHIRYEFTVNGSRQYFGIHSTGVSQIAARFPVGRPARVEYLTSDPTTNRLAHTGAQVGHIYILSFAGFWLVAALGSAFPKLPALFTGYRLLRRGQSTDGTVKSVRLEALRGKDQWVVSYAYFVPPNVWMEGTSNRVFPENPRSWTAGDKGVVYYDPENPRDSILAHRKVTV